ncbi:MAG: hypothetical protein HY764_03220 [Candidatus Portnoybacteria bacterium]|nr:hypothetical protein [Candidatus Portnoybacteria bacterium]
MDKIKILGLVFLSVSLLGFYLAYLYGRRTKKFRWSEYIAIIITPFIFVLALAYFVDIKILGLFAISAVVGFSLEYLCGLTYHKTLNRRLWRYERFSVGGYTSLLTIPMWGISGVIFWFLGKLIGI